MFFRLPRFLPERVKSPTRRCVVGLVLTFGIASAGAEPVRAPIAGLPALHEHHPWDIHRPIGISLEGTVTFVAAADSWLVVQDGVHAAAFHCRTDLSSLQIGDRVRLDASEVYPTIPSVRGFPFHPADAQVVDSLQIHDTHRQDYVDRFQGYLIPPENGSYRFWIASDDSSELWLSDNDRPSNARKIASAPAWTDENDWTRYASQRSLPIELRAGQPYYIEVLHEQADGSDHVSVAWERNGHPREVIGTEYLRAYLPAPGEATAGQPVALDRDTRKGVLRQLWPGTSIGSPADLQPAYASGTSFETEKLTIAVIGHGPMPAPLPIKGAQSLSPADNFRWAETDAEIRSLKRSRDGLDLELGQGEYRTTAHVEKWSGVIPSGFRGYRVHVAGVCEQAFDAEGQSVPGTLWIQQLGELPIVGPASSWDQVPQTHVSELARFGAAGGGDIPVRVRARVVSPSAAQSFTLEDEGTFSAYTSSDGRTWKQLGNEIHVPMRDPVSVGLAVTSHGPQQTLATFDHVRGLGGNVRGDQIGDSPRSGSFTARAGTYTIAGVGNDIWNWQDAFYFVHTELSGDRELVAHITAVDMHSVWAKAGLMIRESLAPDAPFVDLVNVGGNRVSLQWRVAQPHHTTDAEYTEPNEAPAWLKLVRQRHAISCTPLRPTTVAAGELVEAFGYLRQTPTGLVIADGFIRPVPAVDSSRTEAEDRPLLEIRSLSAWGQSAMPNYFRLRGVVTCNCVSNNVHYFAVQDATRGLFLLLNNEVDRRTVEPGTLVDIYCDPIVTGRTTQAVASKVVALGPAAMPKPIPHPMELVGPSKGDGQWIEVEGIVYATANDGAVVRAAGSYVVVEATGMTAADWSRLIDRRVRVQGVASDQHTATLKVLVPAASDVESLPYDVPAASSPARSLAEIASPGIVSDPAHRVHVVATVTFRDRGLALIDDGSGTATVELSRDAELANVGDQAEVVGFPTTNGAGTLTLVYSSMHRLGAATLPAPIRTSAAAVLAGAMGQRLVTFDADVVGIATTESGDVLDLESDGRRFRAWCPAHTRTLESIREGSRIRLTGFAYQGTSYGPADPMSAGNRETAVHIIARSPEDIIYLHGPPWLRLKRALYGVGALTCVLLLVVAWAQILRRRVKQRTTELNATLARLREETERTATLTERQRLAGEIHDSLEQGISGILLQLEAALQSPTCPADVREIIRVACNMVSFSHAEIRHAIHDLHSPVLEGKTLPNALRQIAQLIGARTPAVEVLVRGTPVVLSPELEHHLLRIAQEGTTNAVKHAHASRIEIELVYEPNRVELRIKDDGCGFAAETHLGDTTHFGLRSLRRRAKKMNATLVLKSAPDAGTVVEVVVPLTPEVVT